MLFGVETETYDAEGEVTRTTSTDELTLSEIEQALSQFRGQQMQVPPRYSAIKIQGQAAYKRARAGEELEMAARPIEISRLEIVDWQKPLLILDVACSKGTYIRSLAYDLGRAVGCGAHLAGLMRTRSGPFRLEESITLEELALACTQDEVARYAQPADRALEQYPALHLSEEEELRVRHGNSFSYDIPESTRSLARVYNASGDFIAIATWEPALTKWQPTKVFVAGENS